MDKNNAKGYPDLTAYDALTAVTREERPVKKYMPLVYIASPFSGDTETHIKMAQKFCSFAVGKGYIPLAPHLYYPQFLDDDDKQQRELGLFFALVLLGHCEELWIFGSEITGGMSRELAKAKRRRVKVRYFDYNCEEVSHDGLPG